MSHLQTDDLPQVGALKNFPPDNQLPKKMTQWETVFLGRQLPGKVPPKKNVSSENFQLRELEYDISSAREKAYLRLLIFGS